MGYWLGKSVVEVRRKYIVIAVAIFIPVILHGLLDFGIFMVELAPQQLTSEDELQPWPVVIGILALPLTQLTILIGGGLAIRHAIRKRHELNENLPH